jgi:hypothetical protein
MRQRKLPQIAGIEGAGLGALCQICRITMRNEPGEGNWHDLFSING